MKLIVARLKTGEKRENRREPSVRRRTKVLTVLAGTALTLSVCLLAEQLPGKSLPASVQIGEKGFSLPVICYEDIDTGLLSEDLVWLAEQGYETVDCEQVITFARGLGEPPEKPILLLFGGSARAICTEVLPLLEEQQVCGNAVIFGSDADLYSDSVPKTEEAKLSWNEIRMLDRSDAMELISGSYGMHSKKGVDGRKGVSRLRGESPADYRAELSGDILTMQTRMNEEISHDASVFCYSFGEETDESEAVLKDLGFLMSLTEGDDVDCIEDTDDLFGIEYLCRGKESTEKFFEVIRQDPSA